MPCWEVCLPALPVDYRHVYRHPPTGCLSAGGITHASFGGIGIGLYAGISPILSAAIFSVLSAFGVEWLSKRSDMREDSAIAVFWTFGMAVGIIFSFLAPGFTPDLSHPPVR